MSMGIYAITNSTNGNQYIGSAVNIQQRWREHRSRLRLNKHCNSHLQNAYNKYGESSFIYSVLEVVKEKENLIAVEQQFLDTLHPVYNICPVAGSSLGLACSAETRAKLSATNMGNKYGIGNKNCLGRVYSEETKQKLREAKLGWKHTDEGKRKISEANTGRVCSEEAKANMRLAWVKRKQKISGVLV